MVKNSSNTTSTSRARAPLTKMMKRRAPAPPIRPAAAPAPTRQPKAPVFGPVSTIDTAPISIGNSVTGSPAIVVPVKDGIRVKGRDFLMNIDPTATGITGWTLVAGTPVTPMCMVSSAVKGFANSYAEYYIHGVAFHFITATSTSEAGSITLFINKNRSAPGLPTDGNSFLPTVLSDHNTLLSPLWKNCSAVYFPEPNWYTTNIMNDEGLHEQSPGELFVFTKSTVNTSPGYILVDFDISFRNMQASTKALSLPIARMKYTQVTFSITALAMVQGSGAVFNIATNTLMDGSTTSSAPVSNAIGDIYKCVWNLNDTVFGGGTNATNLLRVSYLSSNISLSLTDGFTFYAVVVTATTALLFGTYEQATSGSTSSAFNWQNNQAAATVSAPIYMSLVGTMASSLLQANI